MAAFTSTWQPPSRGIVFHQPVGLALQSSLIWLTLGNVELAQLLYLAFPFLAGTVGFYLVSGRYLGSKFARGLAATFFMFNPATYGFLIGGSISPLYGHAVLPYAVALLAHNRLGSWQRTTVTMVGLGFFLFIAGVHALGLWLVAGAASTLWRVARKQFRRALHVVFITLAVFAFGLATNAPFYYYVLTELFTPTGDLAAREESLLGVIGASYGGPVHHALAMSGTFNLFDELRWITPFGTVFIGFLVVSAAMIHQWKPRIPRAAMGTLAVIIVVALFIALTRAGLTLILFEEIPGFLVFRAPSKLILLVSGAFALGLGILTDQWRAGAMPFWAWRVSAKTIRVFMGTIIPASLVLILALPYATGNGLLPDVKEPIGTHRIPVEYDELGAWLESQAQLHGEFRTLWFPFRYDDQQIKLLWVDERVAALPLGVNHVTQVVNSGSLHTLPTALCRIAQKDGAAKLQQAGIRYIIIDRESRTDAACGQPAHVARTEITMVLERSPLFTNVFPSNRFKVFEVQHARPWATASSDGVSAPVHVLYEAPTRITVSDIPASTYRVEIMEPHSTSWRAFPPASVEPLANNIMGMAITSPNPFPRTIALTYDQQALHERLIAIWSVGLVCTGLALLPGWWLIRAALFVVRRTHRHGSGITSPR